MSVVEVGQYLVTKDTGHLQRIYEIPIRPKYKHFRTI